MIFYSSLPVMWPSSSITKTVPLGRRLIRSEPDPDGCEFDAGEIVGRVFVVPGGHGSEVLDLVEEPFDEVAVSVQERAEGRDVLAVGHGSAIGPRSLFRQTVSPFVAVVGPVAEQGLTRTERTEHIVRGAAVMGLP